jgi:hypothetical protein
MHPEIEKIWNNFQLEHYFAIGWDKEGKYYECIWSIMDRENCEKCVGKSELELLDFDSEGLPITPKYIPPCTIYFFKDKEYSEQEMLRLVKLKAFF